MNYSKIIPHDCANGEGWRTTLFVSGCTNHCKGCFNPELQDFNHGEQFTMFSLINLMDMLKDPRVQGLSILGGDPLCQDANGLLRLQDICNRVHDLGKTIWIWSGLTWEQIFSPYNNYEDKYRQELIQNVDVFIDGPFVEELKDPSLKWRGSINQRIINVQETLKQGDIVLYE